jgi:hypothetical protein
MLKYSRAVALLVRRQRIHAHGCILVTIDHRTESLLVKAHDGDSVFVAPDDAYEALWRMSADGKDPMIAGFRRPNAIAARRSIAAALVPLEPEPVVIRRRDAPCAPFLETIEKCATAAHIIAPLIGVPPRAGWPVR